MSETFYEKLIGFAFRFFFILFLMILMVQFSVLCLAFGMLALYYLFAFSVVALTVYLFKIYVQIRSFRENLYLYLPQNEKKAEDIEPLNVDLENVEDALRVCVLYRNGKSLTEIERIMGFSHPYETKRLLLKGLDLLLKKYMEGEEGNVEHIEKFRCEAST